MMTLLPAALGLLLQSTALLAFGLSALWLARRRGPAVQTLIGRATLVGVALTLLAVPLSGQVQPLWRVSVPDGPPAPNSGGVREESSVAPPVAAPTAAVPLPSIIRPTNPQPAEPPPAAIPPALPPELPAPLPRPFPLHLLYAVVTAAWGTGTVLLLLWLGLCQRHLSRLRRTARPLTSGPAADALATLTNPPPRMLAHTDVRSPFLAGIVRPAIFLPDSAEADFTPDALRAILAHEIAHLARRDNAWTLLCRLLCAVLWPQALLWVLCRRLEAVGEEDCDQAVLAQACPPRAYADCLLTLAERHPLGRRERALGAGVAPFRSSLGRRVQRILDKGTHAMSAVSTRLRVTIAALTAATVICGMFLVSSAPAKSAGPVPDSDHAGKLSLVGTWLWPCGDGTAHVTIFSADGRIEVIGPWPGNSQEISHSYGRYAVDGSELRYTLIRVWVEGMKPWATDPEKHVEGYTLSGDVLTLRMKRKGGDWVYVNHRVPAYTQEMLGIKPAGVGDAHAHTNYSPTPEEIGRYLLAVHPDPELHPNPELSKVRFLAGLTPVQGPGVVVTLNDSKRSLPKSLPPGMTPNNLIHDTDINQVVNELKAAGAEAIAVNNQRLVANSAIRCAGPTVFINNTPQPPPYTIQAIGDPETLATALNLRGGLASQIKLFDPAMFSVRIDALLTLPAYTESNRPRYVRPLESRTALQNTVGLLTGLTPVEGPGVVVTLSDSNKRFSGRLPRGMTPPSIIHDTDINQVINELRAAGAEAIAVNDQRLVATSSVRDAGATIFINNTPQTPPFVIQAIGNPQTLLAALAIRGGIAAQIKSFDPSMFSIREVATLTLPAYSGETALHYASPASETTSTGKTELNDPHLEQSANRTVASMQTIHFLDSKVTETGVSLRRAASALTAYRAQHPTRLDLRKFADLMRDYQVLKDEHNDFQRRRYAVQTQIGLMRLREQP